VDGTEQLAPQVRQEMYQIAQEALNNALKHSQAQAVKVLLRFDEQGACLEISDDGVGFELDSAKKSGGLGLRSMRERAEKVEGSLEVESSPDGGTRIRVIAPIARVTPPPNALRGVTGRAAPA
jgi:signal transduction histidine kinase